MLSDGNLETLADADDLGLAVRVVVDGTWGFAAAVDLTPDAAARAAAEAVEVARVAAAINTERIELAAEPAHGEVSWVSAYQVDPFRSASPRRSGCWPTGARGCSPATGSTTSTPRCCRSRSASSTATAPPRPPSSGSGSHPERDRVAVEPDGRFETMRTLAPPAGRGYEYLGGSPWSGAAADGAWDFAAELAEMPGLLAAKLAAPASRPAGTTWSSTRRTCG